MPAAVFLNPYEKEFCVCLALLKERDIGRNSQVKDTGMLVETL